MPRPHIPQPLRRLVIERARECCEYCLVTQLTDSGAHHIDHLTAFKHSGRTVSEHLALACIDCNLHKGPALVTLDWASGAIIPLFNPRQHHWRADCWPHGHWSSYCQVAAAK